MQDAFQSHEAILLHLVSVSQSVIQSLNHVLSTLVTAHLSSSLTPANRSYASHVFSLRRSLSSTTPLLCGGHLRDRRDRTSTLPFRVLLPRMPQLCHLHGRVWTSHWRTRVWLWIIHLGDIERKKKIVVLSFFLRPCLSFSTRWCSHEFVSSPFKSRCDVAAACSVVFEVLYLFKYSWLSVVWGWLVLYLVCREAWPQCCCESMVTFFCFLGFLLFSVSPSVPPLDVRDVAIRGKAQTKIQ